jgi:hypothetical protein
LARANGARARAGNLPLEPTADIDAGRRVNEAVTLHILTGSVGRWIAVKLIDGSSDGIAYDSRADAIRHQFHEQLCCYMVITPDGITPEDALRFIRLNRALYDAGYRLADPDMPGEPIYPNTIEEAERYIRELNRGK